MPKTQPLVRALLLTACTLACLPGVAAAQEQLAASAVSTVTAGIPGVVASGTRIELIKEGFSGTEGPVALPDGSFAFTETQAARITRIAPDGTISTLLENTNGANGLGFGAHGELYAVQVLQPRVGVIYPPERAKTLVDKFEGAPFGRPNDLVVSQLGHVYFTDSGANRAAQGAASASAPAAVAAGNTEQTPPNKPAVYRIGNDGGVKRLANDIERPNGIQLSPDEKVLYVANTAGEYVLAYDLADDGTVGPKRNFAKLAGFRQTDTGWSSGADGLAVDARGRLYVATTVGIQVFSPEGQPLGTIALPKPPQNIAFAGPGKRTLYVVGRGAAYKIATIASGYPGRAK